MFSKTKIYVYIFCNIYYNSHLPYIMLCVYIIKFCAFWHVAVGVVLAFQIFYLVVFILNFIALIMIFRYLCCSEGSNKLSRRIGNVLLAAGK